MKRAISVVVILTFIWTNCVYGDVYSYKLAAPPQVAGVGILSRGIQIPAEVLREITVRRITGLEALALDGAKIKEAIIGRYREMKDSGIISSDKFNELESDIRNSYLFLSTDEGGTAVVVYLFNKEKSYLYRMAPRGVVVRDNFLTGFLNEESAVGEALVINGYIIEVYQNPKEIEGISRALTALYGEDVTLPAGGSVEAGRVPDESGGRLDRGWVLANHIFMSIHAAMLFPIYIDKILKALGIVTSVQLFPATFLMEVITGLAIALYTFFIAVGWHERGHYIEAVRQITLNSKFLPDAQERMGKDILIRFFWNIEMLLRIPLGRFPGVNRSGLNYSVDAPYNLAVSAAGPRASRDLSIFSLPFAAVLIIAGFLTGNVILLYIGRVFLGVSVVGFLDFMFADRGEYKKFKLSLRGTGEPPVPEKGSWAKMAKGVKDRMRSERLQEVELPDGRRIRAPWGFRNSAMGGAHTQKEYPESNISMQEGMFIPLKAETYEEAQRMTVELQDKLKEIIERTPGCRVMGIGLEGGLATYITRDPGDKVPEQKLWRLMKQAIEECGYRSGVDVVLALDPAASELQNEYNINKYGTSQEVRTNNWEIGNYLFWRYRDEEVVMTRDDLLDLYRQAINEGIPIVSIEDGFSENDFTGWKKLLAEYGNQLFIIGDDLVTTNDTVIESCIHAGTINTALIKANQIGTLSETVLAMLTALGYGMELVVSHRSKSPNDDMEAHIALAAEAMGLKAGGGANTERLVKYGAIIRLMKDAVKKGVAQAEGVDKTAEDKVSEVMEQVVITGITAYEEATNAGLPTVGVKVTAGIPGSDRFRELLVFTGSTPLGTSAGTHEAIHLVDRIIEKSSLTERYPELFELQADGTYRFEEEVKKTDILAIGNNELTLLWEHTQRYKGMGVLNAVRNVEETLSKLFVGKKVSELRSMGNIDSILMQRELETAIERGKLSPTALTPKKIQFMQRKGNLGMNAILSMSLALARMFGAIQGKALWEVIRDEMNQTIARAVAGQDNAMDIIYSGVSQQKYDQIKAARNETDPKPLDKILIDTLTYTELVKLLQVLTKNLRASGKELHHVLRQALPVYGGADTTVSAPLSKVIQDRPQENLWEAELRNGRVDGNEVLNRILIRLEERYGPGITSGVDIIRGVDNLREGEVDGVVPYSMIVREGNKRVLLLDIDSFNSEVLLYLVLDHEVIEGIMTLIPYESEAIRELTSNYMSIRTALEVGITDVGDVSNLDPDNQFLNIVRHIRDRGITSDREIIALLLEHMRGTPYYRRLFAGFGISDELVRQVEEAGDRFSAALSVFNDIADALVPKVKETERKVREKTEQFNRMISKVKMVASQLSVKQIGLAKSLLQQGKYIRLSVEELEKRPELIDWIRELTEGVDSSPFIFYGENPDAFVSKHNLKQADITGKAITSTNIVTLIDPERVVAGMPQDTLYLALPYAKSTIYLATQVVTAGGRVDGIDALARNTIRALYEALIGEEVSDNMLEQLFSRPWEVLPPIASITDILNAMRTAIANIEVAA